MAEASLEFVGTATTLLRLGPFTLLTDPNFLHQGERAYLGKGMFSKRLTEPSMRPEDSPRLDAILLSHLHGDHFDRIARDELDRRLPVFTTPHATRRLRRWGFTEAVGMATWESTVLMSDETRLTIVSAPGEHAPMVARTLLPPVMGTVLELAGSNESLRIYVTCDTLYRPWLRQVTERHGPLDAFILHLGGTRILGVLVTMDAGQGADLVKLIDPRLTVPIYFDDYTVFRSDLADFRTEWARRDLPGELRTVRRGQVVSLTEPFSKGTTDRRPR